MTHDIKVTQIEAILDNIIEARIELNSLYRSLVYKKDKEKLARALHKLRLAENGSEKACLDARYK